jgi:BirA family transcriptional regulator, biotin operon repressor / biotin---[acetyl-CoA-carboxylase] ligase
MNFTILEFDSIDSTNTEGLKQAQNGADEGLCIVAGRQTAGRGRHGRTWVSPANAGLYASVVLRPTLEQRYLSLITLMTGVAVHATLSDFGVEPDIKWVNDVLARGKKISGILAEATETRSGLAVVVGIGINLKSSNFPPEIIQTATSLEDETVLPASRDELLASLTRFFGYYHSVLNGENGPEQILAEWRNRSTYFAGKNVRVVLQSETIVGVTDGLAPDGALYIRTNDGTRRTIQAGDVELLRTAETNTN